MNGGTRTVRARKRSWKVDLYPGEIAQMSTLNLRSMDSDPAQMRESLVWGLPAAAGIPAARHTYARLSVNGRYLGPGNAGAAGRPRR